MSTKRSQEGLSPKKRVLAHPTPFYSKPLKLDLSSFFRAISKTAVFIAAKEPAKAIAELIGGLQAFTIKTTTEERAWTLLDRSIRKALVGLIYDVDSLLTLPAKECAPLDEDIRQSLADLTIPIDSNFFANPTTIECIPRICAALSMWLHRHGLPIADAERVSSHFPEYFLSSLTIEWSEHFSIYEPLSQWATSPFLPAAERERKWNAYAESLVREIHRPLFGASFGLIEIYVPLRAYFHPNDENSATTASRAPRIDVESNAKVPKKVIELSQAVDAWIEASDRTDAIRVISGDPGAGKSSFTKTLCARYAHRPGLKVIYVPLQSLDIQVEVRDALRAFCKANAFLPDDAIDSVATRLLLVFDGLDELSKRGRAAANLASDFLADLRHFIDISNSNTLRVLALISGRPISVQSTLRFFRREQVFFLVPYFVSNNDRVRFIDPRALLDEDQRNTWWKKYGELTGNAYIKLPNELQRHDLEEITIQPLLNYLLALSYQRQKIDFKNAPSLNSLYADLIEAIYERAYSVQHVAVGNLSLVDFVRFLEDIGLSAWHGDGRSTTIKRIGIRCAKSGMANTMSKFATDGVFGVSQLLLAFYFRQRGENYEGEDTFEFTHKSFGEYLAAMRIVRAINRISSEMLRRDTQGDAGWSWVEALAYWADICGPAAITPEIFRFLRNEVDSLPVPEVSQWRKSLVVLVSYALHHGMQFTVEDQVLSYTEKYRRACNAEESLMAAISCCARREQVLTTGLWKDETSLRRWIQRLSGNGNDIANYLCYLDLSKQNLDAVDLRGADLSWSNLRGVSAQFCCLERADLSFADCTGAFFEKAIFRDASLDYAVLDKSVLEGADFATASLKACKLREAQCEGAFFELANLEKADCSGALMNKCSFWDASFKLAIVDGANFDDSVFTDAMTSYCDWKNASLNNTVGTRSLQRQIADQ